MVVIYSGVGRRVHWIRRSQMFSRVGAQRVGEFPTEVSYTCSQCEQVVMNT